MVTIHSVNTRTTNNTTETCRDLNLSNLCTSHCSNNYLQDKKTLEEYLHKESFEPM